MATVNRLVHRVSGEEILLSAKVGVQTAIARSATDYWTVTLYRRSGSETVGKRVGASVSTAIQGLAAGKQTALYDAETGTALSDGETLWATLVSTGSPATPSDAKMTLVIQRKVA
jgi:hypothetical protein